MCDFIMQDTFSCGPKYEQNGVESIKCVAQYPKIVHIQGRLEKQPERNRSKSLQ